MFEGLSEYLIKNIFSYYVHNFKYFIYLYIEILIILLLKLPFYKLNKS